MTSLHAHAAVWLLTAVVASGCAAHPRARAQRLGVPAHGDGCRFEERPLRHDQSFERWPAPDRIADGLDGVYVGRVRWSGGAAGRPRRIRLTVVVDRDAFVVREVVSGPKPQERIVCRSNMVVPLTMTVRLGRYEAILSSADVSLDGALSPSVRLPREFATHLEFDHVDHNTLSLWFPIEHDGAGGQINLHGPGLRGGLQASFALRRGGRR